MNLIDYEKLENAILDVLVDDNDEKYDIGVILKSAKLVWDNTAIEVKSNDFLMIFDLIDYSLQNYTGYDAM